MAYAGYRLTLKSEEQRGASQANIARLAFNSDADAQIFAANLEAMFDADVQTVDQTLRSNYALTGGTYPAGTNVEARFVMRDAAGHVQTERLYDLLATTTPSAFSALLVAQAPLIVLPQYSGFGGVVTSVQPAFYLPGASY